MASGANQQLEMNKPREKVNGDGFFEDGNGKANDGPDLSSSNGSKGQTDKVEEKPEEKPKPSKAKEIWGKIGLDAGTLVMMFK